MQYDAPTKCRQLTRYYCVASHCADFTVQLDTGSSDLWIHPDAARPVHFTNTTDLTTSETYGENHVEGKIDFADLKIGELTIQRQGTSSPSFSDLPPAR